MTIDKRINFRGGGMDAGNEENQKQSASKASTGGRTKTSSTPKGTSGNIGGGGGGQNSKYRQYKAPTKPVYTSKNIDSKPVTGADYTRSRNQFIDKFNQDKARELYANQKPSIFPRKYKPVTLDQIGSRNQLPSFGESGLGKILMQIAGVATGIPLNMSNAKSKFTNFMGDQREKLTGYRTQQEYDDARQQRINENSIETILTRKPPITEAMQKRLTQLGYGGAMPEVGSTPQTRAINSGILSVEDDSGSEMMKTVGYKNPTDFNYMFNPNNIASLIEASKQPKGIQQLYDFSGIENQVTELLPKQKAFIDSQKNALQYGAQTPQEVFEKINNPNLGIYNDGYFMGMGEQEPTTTNEYNEYLKSIGIKNMLS